MQEAPAQLIAAFDARLDQAHVPQPLWPSYHKWAKFYLLFCQKYEFSPTAPTALERGDRMDGIDRFMLSNLGGDAADQVWCWWWNAIL